MLAWVPFLGIFLVRVTGRVPIFAFKRNRYILKANRASEPNDILVSRIIGPCFCR